MCSWKWQPAPVFLLGNPVGRGAWWAGVHGVAESGRNLSTHTYVHSICRWSEYVWNYRFPKHSINKVNVQSPVPQLHVTCSVMFDSFMTPWTVARQAPWSIGFFRQEYWSGLPFPSLITVPQSLQYENPWQVLMARIFSIIPCFIYVPSVSLCSFNFHATIYAVLL